MSPKKIRVFLYGTLLFLSIMECAFFGEENFSCADTNLLGHSNFIKIDPSGDSVMTDPTAIVERPKENILYRHFYRGEITSDARFTISKQVAQQMMDQAHALCQISQNYWQKGEIDRAIEFLDRAYLLILSINTDDSQTLIQQKKDMRFMISKRIIEIYASRETVINGNQNEIQVIINKQVQYEIDLYAKGILRNHFINSYKRSGKYRQLIVEQLKEENLPRELSWLPLIESGFRVKALSKSRALGLWQFIPSTGYRFGLSRNRYIDERMDPEKSTQAAIGYLKELHSHFGDWSTALAAYNCGENRVLKVIQKQKINYLDNFWDLYANLPQETARYVPKFLATLHIVKNLEKYGLDKITIDTPVKFESLTVTEKIHLEKIAKITGIDQKRLEELNPELRQNIVPGGKYPLKIPEGNKQILLANIDQILRLNPASVNFLSHRVQSGENLSLLARRYRTSVANIMLANNLQGADYIISGRTLKIPQKRNTSEPPEIDKLILGNSFDSKANISRMP